MIKNRILTADEIRWLSTLLAEYYRGISANMMNLKAIIDHIQ